MSHLALRRHFVLLGLLLFTAVLPHRAIGSEPAPQPAIAKYEAQFMESMIDHHAMAVMMGSLCTSRAVHPELLALCTDIVDSQSAEIQTMQAWLQQWYGITATPDVQENRMQRLASLSGSDFEIAFMETMIRHHARALREAAGCVERAFHAELVSLCENIIAAQLAEIQMMRTWLCQWYTICRPEGSADPSQS